MLITIIARTAAETPANAPLAHHHHLRGCARLCTPVSLPGGQQQCEKHQCSRQRSAWKLLTPAVKLACLLKSRTSTEEESECAPQVHYNSWKITGGARHGPAGRFPLWSKRPVEGLKACLAMVVAVRFWCAFWCILPALSVITEMHALSKPSTFQNCIKIKSSFSHSTALFHS